MWTWVGEGARISADSTSASMRCEMGLVYERLVVLSCLLGLLTCCGGGGGKQRGTEGGSCYPNGTCNAGLVCLSQFCVNWSGDMDTVSQPDMVTADHGENDEVCNPQCSGKECGDDGCGGDCGTCNRRHRTVGGLGACVGQVGVPAEILVTEDEIFFWAGVCGQVIRLPGATIAGEGVTTNRALGVIWRAIGSAGIATLISKVDRLTPRNVVGYISLLTCRVTSKVVANVHNWEGDHESAFHSVDRHGEASIVQIERFNVAGWGASTVLALKA